MQSKLSSDILPLRNEKKYVLSYRSLVANLQCMKGKIFSERAVPSKTSQSWDFSWERDNFSEKKKKNPRLVSKICIKGLVAWLTCRINHGTTNMLYHENLEIFSAWFNALQKYFINSRKGIDYCSELNVWFMLELEKFRNRCKRSIDSYLNMCISVVLLYEIIDKHNQTLGIAVC